MTQELINGVGLVTSLSSIVFAFLAFKRSEKQEHRKEGKNECFGWSCLMDGTKLGAFCALHHFSFLTPLQSLSFFFFKNFYWSRVDL